MRPPSGPLTALVVTFNRLKHLQITLAALLASPDAVLARVIVVDNASTDGTAGWLSKQTDPRISTLTLGENRGGAGGFAAGLAAFQELSQDAAGRDWVVLMDDDGRPLPQTLDHFAHKPRQEAHAWCAAVRYPDGRICEMNRPWWHPFATWRTAWATVRRVRAGFHIPDADYRAAQMRPIDGGSFVGLFLHRTALDLAGLPRADLFLYGDDVLFCLALRQAGGRMLFDPKLTFEHDCATDATPKITPLWKAYYLQRNRILMYRKAAGPILIWPVLALFLPRWWLAQRRYDKPERAAYRRLWRAAVADGIWNRTQRSHAHIVALSQY